MALEKVQTSLRRCASKQRAKILQRFFKTGAGEYAEGDIFLGIQVPDIRKVAKQYRDLETRETTRLLKSQLHEERLLALLIFVLKCTKGNDLDKKIIYELYLKHTKYINNWDLVDLSAEHIIGSFLMDKSKKPLYILAKSNMLWERRISIMSTFHFIKNYKFDDTLKIADVLIADQEDLIHKAVGWMLREVGKRNLATEERFLKEYYKKMPRTMLRYAIERFPEAKRQDYLIGKI